MASLHSRLRTLLPALATALQPFFSRPARLVFAALATAHLAHAQVSISGSVTPSPATSPTWNIGGELIVGETAAGDLTIANGGTVTNTIGFIGAYSGSGGIATVSGGNWTNSGNLYVGVLGDGTLNVSNGTVTTPSVSVADQATGTGTVNLTGGVLSTGQVAKGAGHGTVTFNGGTLQLSALEYTFTGTQEELFAGFETGDVTLVGAGGTIDTQAYIVATAAVLSGNSSLTKTGTGTLTLTGANTYTGGTAVNAGTLSMGHAASLGSAGPVTVATGATLDSAAYGFDLTRLSGAGTLTGTGPYTYDSASSTSLATTLAGSGATLTKSGTGSLTLTGANTYTDRTTVRHGTLAIAPGGSIAHPANDLIVGFTSGDNATLTIATGGSVANVFGYIGVDAGSIGTATVSGGTWTNSGELHVGYRGTGTLNLSGGTVSATMVSVGNQATGLGTVNLTSGTLLTGQVSESPGTGTGTVTFNGGTLRLTGNQAALFAGFETGDVTLTGTGGTIDTQAFTIASAHSLSGDGSLTKQGTGTLTLSGANTYTGATTINAGRISLTGSATSSAFTVNSGGTLNGSGSLGTLTINSGGTVSPGNSPGTLNAGNTTWNGGANYLWEINDAADPQSPGATGTNYDLLSVSGTLTINATSENKFTLTLVSLLANNTAGDVVNFNSAVNSSYTIASASGGIIGFDANAFTINSSGFTNNVNGGSWNLAQVGNNLNLNFVAASAIPEPSTYAMIFGALVLGLAAYRKRSARSKRV